MKIAIVYDWIDKWGGVERLLLTLHEMFPEAHWYTSYYDKKSAPWAEKLRIQTSYIQHLPSFIKKSRVLSSVLYPYAFESFDLSTYDVVISVTSSFTKSVITKPQTKHICYLLTPPRYLWGMTDEYLTGWKKVVSAPFLRQLREWDYIAAQRPDVILTLSEHVAERCVHYYHRKADVVYPPFDVEYWLNIKKNIKEKTTGNKQNYYLMVGRMEQYKKMDLVIRAFNTSKRKLIIVGKGTQQQKLKQIASTQIQFIERATDQELAEYYTNAQALILPQEEDFGYVSLEAQVFGCPIISYQKSGIVETTKGIQSAFFFSEQTENSLLEALARFEAVAYNVHKSNELKTAHFEPFSKAHFINTLLTYIS